MLHNTILSGKDSNIDELMFQLQVKYILEMNREGVRRKDFE